MLKVYKSAIGALYEIIVEIKGQYYTVESETKLMLNQPLFPYSPLTFLDMEKDLEFLFDEDKAWVIRNLV